MKLKINPRSRSSEALSKIHSSTLILIQSNMDGGRRPPPVIEVVPHQSLVTLSIHTWCFQNRLGIENVCRKKMINSSYFHKLENHQCIWHLSILHNLISLLFHNNLTRRCIFCGLISSSASSQQSCVAYTRWQQMYTALLRIRTRKSTFASSSMRRQLISRPRIPGHLKLKRFNADWKRVRRPSQRTARRKETSQEKQLCHPAIVLVHVLQACHLINRPLIRLFRPF